MVVARSTEEGVCVRGSEAEVEMEEVEGREEDKNKIGKLKKEQAGEGVRSHGAWRCHTRRKVYQTHNVTRTGGGERRKGNNKCEECVCVNINPWLQFQTLSPREP